MTDEVPPTLGQLWWWWTPVCSRARRAERRVRRRKLSAWPVWLFVPQRLAHAPRLARSISEPEAGTKKDLNLLLFARLIAWRESCCVSSNEAIRKAEFWSEDKQGNIRRLLSASHMLRSSLFFCIRNQQILTRGSVAERALLARDRSWSLV
jgi:hypothetical protein